MKMVLVIQKVDNALAMKNIMEMVVKVCMIRTTVYKFY